MTTIIITPTIKNVIEEYKRLRDEIKPLEKKKDNYSEIIKGYFETYGEIHTKAGLTVVKYVKVIRGMLDSKALQQYQPEVYNKFYKEIEYGKLEIL